MTASPLSPMAPPMGPPAGSSSTAARFTPLDPIRVLRQYLKLLIVVAVVGFLVGVCVYFYRKRYSPEYASTAQLLVTGGVLTPYESNAPDGRPRAGGDVLAALINNQIVLLRSDDVLNEALARDSMQETSWYRSFIDPRERLKDLRNRLGPYSARGSNLISISITGRDPSDLPKILNAVIDVYLLRYRTGVEDRTGNLRKVFFDERARADAEAKQLQAQLRQYKVDHQLPDLGLYNNDAMVAYGELARQRIQFQPALEQARAAYRNLVEAQRRGEMVPTPDDVANVEEAPAVISRIERLRLLREQREVLLNKFGENHRSIRDIDETMLAIEQEKKKEIDKLLRERAMIRIEAAKKTIDAVEEQMANLQTRLEESRKRVQDISEQINEYKRIEELSNAAVKRREQLDQKLDEIRIVMTRPDLQAVEPLLRPTVPERISPRFSSIASGTTFMFGSVALALVFLKELLDQRFKSPADVKLLPNVELLGIVPDAAEDPSGPVRIENAVQRDPSGLIAESFRQVRTAILARVDRRGYKTLMIVCAQGACGTSTVTNNLALSLAYNGKRVLVLDANFRRPVQHELFGARSTPGLVEVLRNTATLDEALVHKEDPKLDILPVGDAKDAPPEVMESPAFRQLLAHLEGRYDLILIDAPPGLLTSESQLLSRHVDAVAVVVRAARDKRGAVGRLLRQLEGHRADVLGLVLNGVRSSVGGYFRQSYEEFYRYRQEVQPGGKSAKGKAAPAAAGKKDGE